MHPILYEVEDLDFFAALKNIQQSGATDHEMENENTCLITNSPLDPFHIVLACKHKFNYEPLYQEVLRQKGSFGMHAYYEKIGIRQIKCPYCRTITNELLPYIGLHPTIKRLAGVNSPVSMCMPGIACSHNNNNSCGANAFYEHNSNPYCLRHYNAALKKTKPEPKSNANANVNVMAVAKCVAEIQTGKNKGKRCTLNAMHCDTVPPLCKKHAKCNVVLYQMH